ncbi:MAG: LuxR C-terminal-related transcriptional regulator [Gammaproteobacteria bacterium]|jgi:hypothetical protein
MNKVNSENCTHDSLGYCKKALGYARLLSFRYHDLRLTRRKTQCLACFILDMTIRQISKVLSVFPRTIQDYISLIKSRFDCKYRYQVTITALLSGFPICKFLSIDYEE